MAAVLILLFFILVAILLLNFGKSTTQKSNSVVIRPISEWSDEELAEDFRKAENALELHKIEYQGAMSNPYVSHITRNLVKSNLENEISRKNLLADEIKRREISRN